MGTDNGKPLTQLDMTVPLHDTKSLVEAMLQHRPNLRFPLAALGVITSAGSDRVWNGVYHPELEALLAPFDLDSLAIIAVVGVVQVVALVSTIHSPKTKPHDVIFIRGKNSRIAAESWGALVQDLLNEMAFEDFLPEPFCRKVIYIEKWDDHGNLNGVAFSELWKGMWTVDNPMSFKHEHTLKCGPNRIINNVVLAVKEVSEHGSALK